MGAMKHCDTCDCGRICSWCGEWKPWSEFYLRSGGGRRSDCKVCVCARVAERMAGPKCSRGGCNADAAVPSRGGFCHPHADEKTAKDAKRHRDKSAMWTKQGLCSICGNEAVGDTTRCPKHSGSRGMIGARALLEANHGKNCMRCGAEPAEPTPFNLHGTVIAHLYPYEDGWGRCQDEPNHDKPGKRC